MASLKLVDAGPEGRSVFELHVGDELSNINGKRVSTLFRAMLTLDTGVLHGGAAATLFDMVRVPTTAH